MDIALILISLGVCLYSLTFLVCLTMIILISTRVRPLKSNISILLTYNTYVTSLLTSSMMLLMYSYSLRGNLYSHESFDGRWCQIRTYLTHVCFCALYYSFVLQAIFRLIRIVFYRRKALQTFGAFLIAVVVQWIVSFLCILPNLLLDDFQYVPLEQNCWVAFENIRGLIMLIVTIFNNPLSIIFTIYTQIIRFTRRSTQVQQRRQNANKRDLIILKRILILVFVIVGIGLPTVGIILIYMITKYVIPFAYHIQGLSISLGVLIASISLVFVTPQIQEIFKQSQAQVHPHETRLMTVVRYNTQQDL